jgi:CHAT domain-containing protein
MRPKQQLCVVLLLANLASAAATAANPTADIDQLLADQRYAEARTSLLALQPHDTDPAQRAYLLGVTCRQLDNADEAISWQQKARDLLSAKPNPALLGSVLSELAELIPTEAASHYEAAWQTLKTCTTQPALAANVRLRFAELQRSRAKYAEAKRLIEEAIDWLNQPLHRSHPECASAHSRAEQNLGQWHHVMGNYPAALEHLLLALTSTTEPSLVWSDLALAHWRMGNLPASRHAFREALAKESPYQAGIRANYAAAALSAIDGNDPQEEILATTTEISQALSSQKLSLSAKLTLAETLRLQAAAHSFLGHAKEATTSLTACQSTLQELTADPKFQALPSSHPVRRNAATTRWALEAISGKDSSASTKEVIACALEQIKSLSSAKSEAERLAFMDHLDLASPIMALPAEARAPHVSALLSSFGLAMREILTLHSLADWQSTLPPASSFLSLFTFRKPIGQQWETSLAAVVVNPTGPPIFIDLGYDLTSALSQANQLRDNLLASATERTKILTALGKFIWGPILPKFASDTTRIFLFLEGPLASLPIPFLRWQDQSVLDSKQWITFIATPETMFHQASKTLPLRSGTWLGIEASNVPLQIPAPKAGWSFPLTLVQNRPLAKLTQVAPELTAVGAQHPQSWLNLAASEAQLRQVLTDKSIHVWHFAGHGVSDSASDGKPNPFSNCLICPQVDLNLAEAENGLLFAGEVASMKLDHLDLAVLSACDTGRGGSQRGEAVFDFSRACHTAGVRDVLVSTTPVADPVAPVLMEAFYESVKRGVDTSESAWLALRKISHSKPNLPSIGSFRLIRGNSSRL